MYKIFCFTVSLSAILSGCASPTVTQAVKPGDVGLNCPTLQNEYSDADRFKKEAEGEKGVTGGNVARLLFWPSIIGTYMNANEAIAAADNRKVHLANLMLQKGCQVPDSMAQGNKSTTPSAEGNNDIATNVNLAAVDGAKDDATIKLTKLKALNDKGVITQEEYNKKKKEILDRM